MKYLFILAILLASGLSFAYTDVGGGTCYCYASPLSDCQDALSSLTCSHVYLNESVNISVRDPYYILLSGSNYSNKVFDCQGNLINDTYIYKSYGIYLLSVSNWTIKNCVITNTVIAIDAASTSGSTFTNLTLENNTYAGLIIVGTPPSSSANMVTDSVVRENTYFDLWMGDTDPLACNDILSNVTGSGNRPIVFVNNQSSLSNMHVSELIFCNASNSVLSNVTVNGSDTLDNNGILSFLSNGMNGTGIRSSKNLYGMYLQYSNFTNISGFAFNSNSYEGIYLSYSSNNSFDSGSLSNGGEAGIIASYSSGNTLRNAIVSGNYYEGIVLYTGSFQNRFSNLTVLENRIYDVYIPAGDSALCSNIFENISSTGGRPILLFNSTTKLANISVSELILCNANNSVLSNITVAGSDSLYNNALFLQQSSNLSVTNITSSNNFYGIYIYGVNRSSISNITAQENSEYDIYMEPQTVIGSSTCTINITNAVGSGGRPILYFNYPFSLSNAHLSELILCNSNGSSVTNVTVNGSQTFRNNAFLLFYSTAVNVTGMQSVHNYVGLWAYQLSNGTLRNITLLDNRNDGMDASCTNCNISDVLASYNGASGVLVSGSEIAMSNVVASHHTTQGAQGVFFSCSYSTLNNVTTFNNSNSGISVSSYGANITNFNVSNSSYGITVSGAYVLVNNGTAWGNSFAGVDLNSGYYNMLSNITSTGNPYGFMVGVSYSFQVYDNNITDCTIANNSLYGMYVQNSSSNYIYNNYFNNTNNAFSVGIYSVNNWSTTRCSGGANGNIAYPAAPACLGGNFWSDYVGIDTNGDYIGETNLPYAIGGGGSDWLPLTRGDMMDVMNITLISPANGAYFNDTVPRLVPLTWLAINDKSSSLLCNVTVNGALINSSLAVANNSAYTLNATFSQESAYDWNVTCWSPLNSSGTSSTWRFGIDVTAPKGENGSSDITLIQPADNSAFNVTTLNFSWYAEDNVATVLKCDYYMDGALVLANVNSTNATVTNITRTGLAEGNHSWNVTCRDDANNSAYSPIWHFIVDTEAPQGNSSSNITLLQPADNSAFNVTTLNFSWYAQDNLAPVLKCDYYMDGALVLANVNSTNATVTNIIQIGIAQGNHSWNVTCRDDANNSAYSPIWHFIVDTEPPTGISGSNEISLIYPPDYSGISDINLELSWYAQDNIATVLSCDVYLNSLLYAADVAAYNGTDAYAPSIDNISEGNYNWSVTCRDYANNSAYSPLWHFTVDRTNPTGQNGSENVTLFTPPDYSVWNVTAINFSWYVEDNLAANLACDYYLDGALLIAGIPSPNATVASKQIDVSSKNLQFDRYYDGFSNHSDYGYHVAPTADGGYIIAAETDTNTRTKAVDAWLIKTDSNGTPQWNATYGGSGHDAARSVVQIADGSYAVLATSNSFGAGNDFWLIKTDDRGSTEWSKTFGDAGNDSGYSLASTADGGYILAGSTEVFSGKTSHLEAWLIKTDSRGNAEWNYTFGGGAIDSQIAYSVVQATDGGYAVAGVREVPGATGFDMWLAKIDSRGVLEWQDSIGGSGDQEAHAVRQTSDGGYVIAGQDSNNGWTVAKTNSHGDVQWYNTYFTGGDSANSIIEMPGGLGFMATGYTGSSLALLELDPSGGIDWQDTLFSKDANSSANSIQATPDGGFVVVGYSEESRSDVWLLKYSLSGDDGQHTWQMQCADQAGNLALSPVWHFLLDSTPPTVTLVSPANNAVVTSQNSRNLVWTANDNIASTMNCSIYLDSSLVGTQVAADNNLSEIMSGTLSFGHHEWNVSCMDEVNLTGYSPTWQFDVDNASLVAVELAPANVTNSTDLARWNGTSAGNLTTAGGNITTTNINGTMLTDRWAAFFGDVGATVFLWDGSNYVYAWNWTPSNGGLVCVSTNSSLGDEFYAMGANGSDIDSAWGFADAGDSGVNTFNGTNCSLSFSGTVIGNADYAITGTSGNFSTCAFKTESPVQQKDDMFFCVNIVQGGTLWNGGSGNYEVIVPTEYGPSGVEIYYFYLSLD